MLILFQVHPIYHPVPFIGIESGKKGRIYTFQEAYKFLGLQEGFFHPGHPTQPSPRSPQDAPPPDLVASESYSRGELGDISGKRSVGDVSRILYSLAPSINGITAESQPSIAHGSVLSHFPKARPYYYQDLKLCVAVICRELLKADDQLQYAIPVRIGFDYDEPCAGAPTQWAAVLTFVNGIKVLLPLSLSLRGSETTYLSSPDQYFFQGWTIDHLVVKGQDERRRNFYTELSNALSCFKASPVLHITDVDMLFLCDRKAFQCQPRRYSAFWTLYDTILHATWRRAVPSSPVAGVYTDLPALISKIRIRGSQITSVRGPQTSQPFQLYRENDFVLRHMISESDIPFDLIKRILRLEKSDLGQEDDDSDESPTEEGPEEDLETDLTKQELAKRNSMLRILRSGERMVDEKPRCEFHTCPFPKAPSSRYCDIHSAEILRIIASDPDRGDETERGDQQAPEWQLSLRQDCEMDLRHLKQYYLANPEANWIIDFEFLSIRTKSPIPLQLSIRQIDGKPLLDTNVDYGISLVETIETASQHTAANLGPSLFRVYESYRTNGLKPSHVRARIQDELGYNPNKVNIFSWFSSQDMQCFRRILTGANGVIVERQTHADSNNFNQINIAALCQKLLPAGWPSMVLETAHYSLLKSKSRQADSQSDQYHTAAYDTQAVTDIVEAMIELV